MVDRQKAEVVVNYCKANVYFSTIKNLEQFIWGLLDYFESPELVLSHFKSMTNWLNANPNRHKKNYARFALNWLNREKAGFDARRAFERVCSGITKSV